MASNASDTKAPVRIAMWSGPRNISTALMRSWGNRQDTVVCDEPFYAHYLTMTQLPHPGAEQVVRQHESDWRKVCRWLLGPLPPGKTVFYQKHMAHHLLPNIESSWLDRVTNCFLIRQPQEMLTSLIGFISQPTLRDTGLPQQIEIFERVHRKTGQVPAVLDARDVLEDPASLLQLLCHAVQVPFDEAMLSWAPGPRTTDGVWAKHWYAKVWKTTRFVSYRPKTTPLPESLKPLLSQCQAIYDELHRHRLIKNR